MVNWRKKHCFLEPRRLVYLPPVNTPLQQPWSFRYWTWEGRRTGPACPVHGNPVRGTAGVCLWAKGSADWLVLSVCSTRRCRRLSLETAPAEEELGCCPLLITAREFNVFLQFCNSESCSTTRRQVATCVATALRNLPAVGLERVCGCRQAARLHPEKPSTSPGRSSACRAARQAACLSLALAVTLEQIVHAIQK